MESVLFQRDLQLNEWNNKRVPSIIPKSAKKTTLCDIFYTEIMVAVKNNSLAYISTENHLSLRYEYSFSMLFDTHTYTRYMKLQIRKISKIFGLPSN